MYELTLIGNTLMALSAELMSAAGLFSRLTESELVVEHGTAVVREEPAPAPAPAPVKRGKRAAAAQKGAGRVVAPGSLRARVLERVAAGPAEFEVRDLVAQIGAENKPVANILNSLKRAGQLESVRYGKYRRAASFRTADAPSAKEAEYRKLREEMHIKVPGINVGKGGDPGEG